MQHYRVLFMTLFLIIPVFSYAHAESAAGIPSKFIRHEHDQIYARLERLAKTSGETGKAARTLLTIIRSHLLKEEEFVLPQLGILKSLALDGAAAETLWAVERSEKLKENYPQMLTEHKAVFVSIDSLRQAAALDGDQTALNLAEQLKAHIQDEEDIVYPAAILVGEYIKKNRPH